MASVHGLKNRIKSLESTKQMTKSMKTVSATRLRKNQIAYMRLRPYADQCREMLLGLVGEQGGSHALLRGRDEIKSRCYVLFVGNRGLCGVYNHNLIRFFGENLENDDCEKFLVICGRWDGEAIGRLGIRVERIFSDFSDTPSAAEAKELCDYLTGLYLTEQADEIVMVHQRYDSVIQQTPIRYRLLPVNACGDGNCGKEYIFEPDRETILEMLARNYAESMVYAALLEARTGEQAARMTAMTTASDNADELISKLRLKLNHIRQAAITTEIAEISGGSMQHNN